MPTRSTRSKKVAPKVKPSASYWLGYVEDGESTEMIMKKFEKMEELLKKESENGENSASEESNKTDGVQNEISSTNGENPKSEVLSENQLEALFKETSSFSVNMMLDEHNIDMEQDPEEMDYTYFSDEEEEFFSEGDFDDDGSSRGKSKRKSDKKYELEQITTEDGFTYTVKKKAKFIDPNLPSFTKIPPEPLTLSWARPILPYSVQEKTVPCSSCIEDDILNMNAYLKTLKSNQIQAIMMDPPWKSPGNPDNYVVAKQLEKLDINAVIPKLGFAFVWVEKECIAHAVKLMAKWDFIYAENLAWVKMTVDNQLQTDERKYFKGCKSSLLIFKKGNGLELRHQRNPDVVFDFVRNDKKFSEDKPDFVYHVIETLLPTAKTADDEPPKMLELWAKKGKKRRGWITVSQK